jgi:hypothetical protein
VPSAPRTKAWARSTPSRQTLVFADARLSFKNERSGAIAILPQGRRRSPQTLAAGRRVAPPQPSSEVSEVLTPYVNEGNAFARFARTAPEAPQLRRTTASRAHTAVFSSDNDRIRADPAGGCRKLPPVSGNSRKVIA